MLPQDILKPIITLLSIVLAFPPFLFPSVAGADDFDSVVQQGRAQGSGFSGAYSPLNLDQTLQGKGLGPSQSLVPRIDEARQDQSSYTQYYSNPGAMGPAETNTDVSSFVQEIFEGRQSFDLSRDPAFGDRCLQEDEEGRCLLWSAAKDIIANTYKDCDKVVIPQYGDPPSEAVCTGSDTIRTTQCEVRTFIDILTEDIGVTCDQYSPDYREGQIFAGCKDYYRWYRVYAGIGTDVDDCECWNHGGAYCSTPPLFDAVSSPPEGATYLGTGYQNFWDRNKRSGWDACTSDRYNWYMQYEKSVVERLFLRKDSPCGDNMDRWAQECTVRSLEQCDPAGGNCIVSIEDGEDTGLMPDFDYLTKVLQGVVTASPSSPCTYDYYYAAEDMVWYWSCPGSWCISGNCPAGAVEKSEPSGSSVKTGEAAASAYLDYNAYPPPQLVYDQYFYYKDPRVCQDFAGSLDNYLICLKYYTIDFGNSTGQRTLSTTPVRVDSSENYFGAPVKRFRIFGGLDVPQYLNNWYSRVTFNCEEATDNCQDLRDNGCVLFSQRCLDSNCDELEYTYRCGRTGGLKGYQVAYNCLGEIRCMGTECTDASYEGSQDFQAVAAAMEVLSQYRADSTGLEIFPGEEEDCQRSPKNCCKNPGAGGMSIGDYVKAGKAAVSAYSMLSGGASATMASYANAFTYALTSGSAGSLEGLLGVTISDLMGTTTGSVYLTPGIYMETVAPNMQALGTIGIDAAQTEAGMALTANAELVSTLSTIATAVTIALVIYSVAMFVYDFVFQCTSEDIMTSYKAGMGLCSEVGTRCASKKLGVCIKKEKVYCCFNSLLARVLHEQARPQIGKGWGDPENPDCSGFSPGELASIDFTKVDLSEYLQHIQHKTEIPSDKAAEIMERVKQGLR